MIRLMFCFLVLMSLGRAGDEKPIVEAHLFSTKVTPKPFRLPEHLKSYESLFHFGVGWIPEGLLVNGGLLLGNKNFGLSSNQTNELTTLLNAAYTSIAKDPAFAGVPSAFPHCFSRVKQKRGHYFVSYPKTIDDFTKTIVFLHGYGGNFQFWTWVLREEFPEHIVIVPSWGISWGLGPAEYAMDAVTDVERRFDIEIDRPWLMAISGGGGKGFQIYVEKPKQFRGYICIASAPVNNDIKKLKPGMKVMMINGKEDKMCPLKLARRQALACKRKLPGFVFAPVDGSHFFILSNRQETFASMRRFMRE